MFALQTLGVAVRNVFAGEIMRRRVTDELARLGDRELADMGISRSDIRRIAREAAVEAAAVPADVPAAQAARPRPVTGTPHHA